MRVSVTLWYLYNRHIYFSLNSICVVLMVFINSGGGSYWWIGHSEWNGATMPDFIFPSFLFLMGFCIPYSISSKLAKKFTKCQIFLEIIKVIVIFNIKSFRQNHNSLL